MALKQKMNKVIKIFLAITGGFSLVFDIVTPILLVLFLITSKYFIMIVSNVDLYLFSFNINWTVIFIIAAIVATFYRGIKHLFDLN